MALRYACKAADCGKGMVIKMIKVITVDDEAPIRAWILSLLKKLPEYYDCCGEARNGREALKLIEKVKPELVLTDIRMVDMDGLQFLEAVKADDGQMDVVILSNYDDFSYARTSFMNGAVEYLLKSELNMERLIQLHDKLIAARNTAYGNRLRQTAKNDFMYALLKEKELSREEILELVKSYDVKLMDGVVASVMIFIPEQTDIDGVISKIETVLIYERIENLNMFLLVHPQRLVLVFNVLHNSFMFQNYIYNEYVRLLFQAIELPMGISEILYGIANLQKAVRQSNSALYSQINSDGKSISIRKYDLLISTENKWKYQEMEKLYENLRERIVRRDGEGFSEKLGQFLEMAGGRRDFYPVQTDRMLEGLLLEMKTQTGEEMSSQGKSDKKIGELDFPKIKGIFETEGKRFERAAQNTSTAVKGVIGYVEVHYATIVSMQEIAEKLNYNTDYLYRVFKTEMGVSFVNYLTQVRMAHGAKMLADTEWDIATIAEKAGYGSGSYFSQKFREMYGETPMNWRKRHRNISG